MQKPDILYHGSSAGIADGLLAARRQKGDIDGDFPEGPRELVFATHDRNMAILYTLKNKHMRQVASDSPFPIGIFTDYEQWKQQIDNSACALYELPSATFTNTISKHTGKPTVEWLSSEAVKAISTTRFTPEDVMRTGAQLYFLDPHIDETLWNAYHKRLEEVTSLPKGYNGAHGVRELMDAGLIERHLNAETGIMPASLPAPIKIEAISQNVQWLKGQVAMRKAANITKKAGVMVLGDEVEPAVPPSARQSEAMR